MGRTVRRLHKRVTHGSRLPSSTWTWSVETFQLQHLVADETGEHNIIHEQYKTWEQVSLNRLSNSFRDPLQPEWAGTYTRRPETDPRQAKKVHTPHDASLAPSGILEATHVGEALKREYKKGMPVPERFFVSSLKRTGETCGLEWGWNNVSEKTGEEDRGCGVRATVIEVISADETNHVRYRRS